jgi:hypothetical protein|tara:strand:+ start:672 stop:1502 length:831 start_codon:yes stop_codon:yes gene_type:complete
MKNILLIILIFISNSSFSQVEIDTSEIKSIRYEWLINKKPNDSTLNEILTEYKSGIFKEEFSNFGSEKSKFGHYFIYDKNNSDGKLKAEVNNIEFGVGNVFQRNYYDKQGNLDSIRQKLWKNDSLKELSFVTRKTYDDESRLLTLSERSKTYHYSYNNSNQITLIDYYNDSIHKEVKKYKNGQLISRKFPQRKKYRKEFTYQYDNKNRMIRKDNDDYIYYIFNYNDFGIESIEKIYKKKNERVGIETFEYNKKGQLLIRKEFMKGHLINEFHYTYK